MEKALPYRHYVHTPFPAADVPYASPARVVFRDGKLQLDNGNCSGATTLAVLHREGADLQGGLLSWP